MTKYCVPCITKISPACTGYNQIWNILNRKWTILVKTSMCIVVWFLTKAHPVAMSPFVEYTAHVFLRTNLMFPEISESLWTSKAPTCLVDTKPIKAAALERGLLIKPLSHSCSAPRCLTVSCQETISWKANLALEDSVFPQSDKGKLSWVQTGCLCSQKYFLPSYQQSHSSASRWNKMFSPFEGWLCIYVCMFVSLSLGCTCLVQYST